MGAEHTYKVSRHWSVKEWVTHPGPVEGCPVCEREAAEAHPDRQHT